MQFHIKPGHLFGAKQLHLELSFFVILVAVLLLHLLDLEVLAAFHHAHALQFVVIFFFVLFAAFALLRLLFLFLCLGLLPLLFNLLFCLL